MRSQSLSDSEIVAIAAVAAAALGGVVIGLGRGQDTAVSNRSLSLPTSASERTRRIAERTKEALDETGVSERLPEVAESVRERARALAEQAPSRDRMRLKGADISRSVRRIDPSAIRSSVESLAKNPASVTHLTRSRGGNGPVRNLGNIARKVTSAAIGKVGARGDNRHPGRSGAVMPAVQTAADRARLGVAQLAHEVEERASSISAPELPRIEERATRAKTRVGDAVQRAAGRSKAVAGETVATALWLAAASAVVYFLLLSAERREQVKSAICGAFEQLRLLALDLQGYEPEM